MNWFRWKDLFYPEWKHSHKIEYVYSSSDINWNPDIYFSNIQVIDNNIDQKLLYMVTTTSQPYEFCKEFITMFFPSPQYITQDIEMTWDECDCYIREKYKGNISKGISDTVILKIGMRRFCYYIRDEKRKIIYYSDDRDTLMNKLRIPPDSLYGRNIWI